ncbi:exocyst complex component 3-like protein isoform X1 [Acipenser ruthenus]|uniref:exocyst complex component 3-like protein isoform X1 n=1 Tax=Acipenser ruthenus TaxID=7906 RepID=UPI00274278D1|nr:exocyst complex component 3-like protein isoform X1 [Acipenser ruthenus]
MPESSSPLPLQATVPAPGMSADDDTQNTGAADVWPELEKAEKLARGAALKWASGVFYRPDQLERLGQYRKRESQRTSSIQSRLKSAVQSYLEGVGSGLEQLRLALADTREVSCTLGEVRSEWSGKASGFQSLEHLREIASEHERLAAAYNNLPHLFSVPVAVMETRRLIESRQLLEAHAHLMELEGWQDDIHRQLQRTSGPSSEGASLVFDYFAGVRQLGEAFAKELWEVIRCGLVLVRQDPTPFVSAVRIIEREERIDCTLLDTHDANPRFMPPGRPKNWRTKFFLVIEEAIAVRFQATYLDIRGPELANHLVALQNSIMNDLITVKYLLEQCCPPHYHISRAYMLMYHKCLSAYLQQVVSWDLESSEIFTVLNWVLHVYHSPEMMGHPDLCSDEDFEELGPLISQDALEQMQNKYVNTVRASVSEWMQKALEVELLDWQRNQEPDFDHEGFYQTSLPTIIIQMLEENARVALVISEALRDQMIVMGLYELETFLTRLREALVDYGKEWRKDHTNPKYYLHYLLAAINSCISLRGAIESLQQQQSTAPQYINRAPPCPQVVLERTTKRACRLVIDELLFEVQPQFLHLLSRSWLSDCEVIDGICNSVDQHFSHCRRVREPYFQFLVVESQWALVVEYVRTLMQKPMVCRNSEERSHLSDRMAQDALQLGDLFHRMSSRQDDDHWACSQGPQSCEMLTGVLSALAEFIRINDTSMLSLEVSGLITKYPDISEEHVLVLLDVRGDVPREVRGTVLDILQQNTHPLPQGYRPIFNDILVPARSMPFCLPTVKCA